MKLALAAALAALTWFPIAAHTFTVCVIPSSPWTSCSTNVTLPITFAGFDVELFRFVAAQVGWREDAGSHNASVASGQWAFRCSNQYWDPLLARMSANNSEDPAAAPCAALIGSVIPTALRYQAGSQFSAPHYHTGLAMMVARNTHSYFDIWGFLKPFDWSMWVSLGVTLLLMPAIVWFVERLNVHGYIPLSWTSLHECKAATYSTLLACFNIKVYDVTTLPARLVVVMYLFLVLITISTYTANLASVFTTSLPTDGSIKSWMDLIALPTAAPAIYCAGLQSRYGLKYLIPMNGGSRVDHLTQGRDHLLSKVLTAYITNLENLQEFLGADGYNADCKLSLLKFDILEPALNFAFAFHAAFPRSLVDHDVSAAISTAEERGLLYELHEKWLQFTDPCASPAPTSVSIRFYQLSGLWIILAASLGVALCWTAVTIVKLTRHHMRDLYRLRLEEAQDGDSSAGGGGGRPAPSHSKFIAQAMARVFVPPSKVHLVNSSAQSSLARRTPDLHVLIEGSVWEQQQQQQQQQQHDQHRSTAGSSRHAGHQRHPPPSVSPPSPSAHSLSGSPGSETNLLSLFGRGSHEARPSARSNRTLHGAGAGSGGSGGGGTAAVTRQQSEEVSFASSMPFPSRFSLHRQSGGDFAGQAPVEGVDGAEENEEEEDGVQGAQAAVRPALSPGARGEGRGESDGGDVCGVGAAVSVVLDGGGGGSSHPLAAGAAEVTRAEEQHPQRRRWKRSATSPGSREAANGRRRSGENSRAHDGCGGGGSSDSSCTSPRSVCCPSPF